MQDVTVQFRAVAFGILRQMRSPITECVLIFVSSGCLGHIWDIVGPHGETALELRLN